MIKLSFQEGDIIICEAFDLHDEIENRTYKGEGEKIGTNLFLNFKETNGNRLHLLGNIGNLNPKNINVLFCSCQGVNDKNQPLSTEAIMVRKNEYGVLSISPEKIDSIYFYLMMQRRNYRIGTIAENHLDKLKAKNYYYSDIVHIKGVYRVWVLSSREEAIVQQKVKIHNDFKITIQSPINSKNEELTCLFSISKINRLKLCLSIHQRNGTEIVGYAITDMPSHVDDKILIGAYSFIGNSIATSPYSGYMALVKEKENFKSSILTQHQLDDLLSKSKKKVELLQKLVEINQQNNKNIPDKFLANYNEYI